MMDDRMGRTMRLTKPPVHTRSVCEDAGIQSVAGWGERRLYIQDSTVRPRFRDSCLHICRFVPTPGVASGRTAQREWSTRGRAMTTTHGQGL